MGQQLDYFVRWYQRFTSPSGQGWISTRNSHRSLGAGVELAGYDNAVIQAGDHDQRGNQIAVDFLRV